MCVGYGTKRVKLIDSDEIKIPEFLITYLHTYVHNRDLLIRIKDFS